MLAERWLFLEVKFGNLRIREGIVAFDEGSTGNGGRWSGASIIISLTLFHE